MMKKFMNGLRYISEFMAMPPSYREISKELNISINTVHCSIQRLLDKGLLETDVKINGKSVPRAFRVAGAKVYIEETELKVFGGH